jgi:hypothetical protein
MHWTSFAAGAAVLFCVEIVVGFWFLRFLSRLSEREAVAQRSLQPIVFPQQRRTRLSH